MDNIHVQNSENIDHISKPVEVTYQTFVWQ